MTANKTNRVKEVFENPKRYFNTRQYDVRIRVETVRALTEDLSYERVLDIGCGDGSISLPLVRLQKSFTLLDLSEGMVARVQSNLPSDLASCVDVRNEDFMTASFRPGSFDLIICLGVVAHVNSPEELVARIARLLRPGGSLILEFTDSFNLTGRMSGYVRRLRALVAPPRYPVNLMSFARVSELLSRHDLRVVSTFRYGLLPIPGIELLSNKARYGLVRLINGTYKKRRNSWWGDEYIILLTRNRPAGSDRAAGECETVAKADTVR